MSHFDVFNGDADGLCSLHQLRLAAPCEATLITGAKRDVALLGGVAAQRGDSVTALDVSLDTNRAALLALLERGVAVEYFDHHYAGALPSHPALQAHIDPSPDVCTGIVVDRYLAGKHRIWAIVAAFGDNLVAAATRLAASLRLDPGRLATLQELGEGLTYNGYGDQASDLIMHPAELYRRLARYADPFAFVQGEAMFRHISESRRRDLALAQRIEPAQTFAGATVYLLPDAAWSRRVRGIFGNELARRQPQTAHAILTPGANGVYVVSVRAPLAAATGADTLCRRFAAGGGRAAAAGINQLPQEQLADFMRQFGEAFGSRPDER